MTISLAQQAETIECFLASQRGILRQARERGHAITIAQCEADMPVLEAAMKTLKALSAIGEDRCRDFIQTERARAA